MNNKTFALCTLLAASGLQIHTVNADTDWSLDLSVKPWFSSWEQNSTAASRFGADAIQVNYQIKDSVAYDLELAVGFRNFLISLESIQQNKDVDSQNNEVSYTKFGVIAADIFDGVNMDYRHTSGEFSGFIDGTANNGNTGTGEFKTDLTLQDISFLFFKGIGVGLRQVDYDLPQDLYLVNKSAPNTAITAGFQDVTYSGTFIQVVAMSEDYFKQKSEQELGWSYIARYGIGKLDPGGKFLSDTESLLRSSSLLGSNENIMQQGDSSFIEADVSFYQRFNLSGSRVKTSLGYRYTQWEAEFGSNSNYQLVTDFKTTFSGPYISITGEF